MNLTEFKARVRNKLFITQSDSTQFEYESKIVPTLNECLVTIANNTISNRTYREVVLIDNLKVNLSTLFGDIVIDGIITQPKVKVLSVLYVDTQVPGASYYYMDNNTIKFSSAGAYTIVADCLYPTIDENDTLNILDTLPESLVTIAVMYVAGQLMKDIDLTEALTTLNEYEYALARLDVDRQELNESFTISGGF